MNDKRENKIKEIRAIVEKVITGEKAVCCALLIIMLLITFFQVVMRFIFNSPFSWSEERACRLTFFTIPMQRCTFFTTGCLWL